MRIQQVTWIILTFCFITAIMGHIKDFIIENENDLQSFGSSPGTEQYYEDDLDSEWMNDECGGVVSAGDYGYNPYAEYQANEGMNSDYDVSQIDRNLLKEILGQMKNDPRFEHLWEHLDEENMFLQNKMPEYAEDRSDYFVDLDENYETKEINY